MSKLRFALIGAGGMGGGHLASLHANPRVDLRVICDANPAVLDGCKDLGAALTSDFHEALSVEGRRDGHLLAA